MNLRRMTSYIEHLETDGYAANYTLWNIVPMVEHIYPHEWLEMPEDEFEETMKLCEVMDDPKDYAAILRERYLTIYPERQAQKDE